MRVSAIEQIGNWLDAAGALSESLMSDFRLDKFGYAVHVGFRVVADQQGHVLPDPIDVTFELDGVQHLVLRGGLTSRMLEHPEEINWGLSEVARVSVTTTADGVRFEALWEGGDRWIQVDCRRASLSVPDG